MKKFFGVLLDIVGIGLCLWGCWLGIWERQLFDILWILGGLVVCFFSLGLYDTGSLRPLKGVNRWVRTALFVSCLFALVLIMFQRRLSHVGWYCVLMGLAVVYYCVDYGRHLPLDKRVEKLQNSLRIPLEDNFRFCISGYEERDGILWAKGKLHGRLRVHDMAYLLAPHFQTVFVEIEKILSNGVSVKKAVDGDVEVSLFVDEDFGSLPLHGLLTSEMPFAMSDPDINVVSNPYLRALLAHEIAVGSDMEYHRLLKEALEQAVFLVMGTSRKQIDDVMERVAVQGNLSLGAVKSEKGTFLAAFTDWDALVRWRQMMSNEHAYSLALPFKDVARLLGKAYAGIVINPFGPDGFAMTPEQIEDLGENRNEYQ